MDQQSQAEPQIKGPSPSSPRPRPVFKGRTQEHKGGSHHCEMCGEVFRSLKQSKSHMCCRIGKAGIKVKGAANLRRSVHTQGGEQHPQRKSLECSVCGKTFKQSAALLRHEQSHNTKDCCEMYMYYGGGTSEGSKLQEHLKHCNAIWRMKAAMPSSEQKQSLTLTKAAARRMRQVVVKEPGVTNKEGKRLHPKLMKASFDTKNGDTTVKCKQIGSVSGVRIAVGSEQQYRRTAKVISLTRNRTQSKESKDTRQSAWVDSPERGGARSHGAIICNQAGKITEDLPKQEPSASEAWSILSGNADDQTEKSQCMSVKDCGTAVPLKQSLCVTSLVPDGIKKPSEVTYVRKQLLGVNRSAQQCARIAETSKLLGVISILHENMTRLASHSPLAADGDHMETNTMAETTQGTPIRTLDITPTSSPERVEGDIYFPDEDGREGLVASDFSNESSNSDAAASDDDDYDDDDVDDYDDYERILSKASDASNRNQHGRSLGEGKSKRFFCSICQKDYLNLKRHMLMHSGDRSHKCDECGKAFYEKRVLEKHKTTHVKRFKCGVCGEKFSKVRAAKRHAKVHLAERPYVCELCKRPFRTRRELRKHVAIHSNVRQYICDICGHGSRTKSAFRNHQRSHTGEKAYICEVCGKAFKYASGLRVHNFSHTSGKPYRCQVCLESFAHNYLLKRHILTHDEEQLGEAQTVIRTEKQIQSNTSTGAVQSKARNTGPEESETCEVLTSQLPHTVSQGTISLSHLSMPSHTVEHPTSDEPSIAQSVSDHSLVPGATEQIDQPQAPLPGLHPSAAAAQLQYVVPQAQQSMLSSPDAAGLGSNRSDPMMSGGFPIQKFLGPDMLKENLIYGAGSRRQTVEDSLVIPLCDGSYKALKELQLEGEDD